MIFMKRYVIFSWLAGSLLLSPAKAYCGSSVDIQKALKQADLARSGSEEGMTWNVTLTSHEQGTDTESQFTVKTLGDQALVETNTPARRRGETMLFLGRILWFTKPGLSRPVSLSSRQRLSGQAANGDIARTNYVRDYTPKLLKEETIDGRECLVLGLEAKANDTTYDKITYWVSKDTLQGIKAQYQALDGTPLKNATFTYGEKIQIKGQPVAFVKTIRIEDANNSKNYSVMSFEGVKAEKHPGSIFDVNALKR